VEKENLARERRAGITAIMAAAPSFLRERSCNLKAKQN